MFGRFFSKKEPKQQKTQSQLASDIPEWKDAIGPSGDVWQEITWDRTVEKKQQNKEEEKPKAKGNVWNKIWEAFKSLFKKKELDPEIQRQRQEQPKKRRITSMLHLPSMDFKHRRQVTQEKVMQRERGAQRER